MEAMWSLPSYHIKDKTQIYRRFRNIMVNNSVENDIQIGGKTVIKSNDNWFIRKINIFEGN